MGEFEIGNSVVQGSLAAGLVGTGLTGAKNGSRQVCEEVMMVSYTKLVAIETGLWVRPTHFADEDNEARKQGVACPRSSHFWS